MLRNGCVIGSSDLKNSITISSSLIYRKTPSYQTHSIVVILPKCGLSHSKLRRLGGYGKGEWQSLFANSASPNGWNSSENCVYSSKNGSLRPSSINTTDGQLEQLL